MCQNEGSWFSDSEEWQRADQRSVINSGVPRRAQMGLTYSTGRELCLDSGHDLRGKFSNQAPPAWQHPPRVSQEIVHSKHISIVQWLSNTFISGLLTNPVHCVLHQLIWLSKFVVHFALAVLLRSHIRLDPHRPGSHCI